MALWLVICNWIEMQQNGSKYARNYFNFCSLTQFPISYDWQPLVARDTGIVLFQIPSQIDKQI